MVMDGRLCRKDRDLYGPYAYMIHDLNVFFAQKGSVGEEVYTGSAESGSQGKVVDAWHEHGLAARQ